VKCEQVQISLQICTYQLFRASHKNLCVNIYHFLDYIWGGGSIGVSLQIKRPCLHVFGFRRQFISPMKRVGFYSTTRSCLICHCYHLSSFEYECARRGLPTSFGVIIVFICLLHQSVMTITNYELLTQKNLQINLDDLVDVMTLMFDVSLLCPLDIGLPTLTANGFFILGSFELSHLIIT